MVAVEGGNVLHRVKREGELSGRGNVREECPDAATMHYALY